jgi:hypothetical protein
MKTNTSGPAKKKIKKTINKQIQKSLKLRFLEAVLALGYNAAVIANDIKKMSKVAAKKIAKQLDSHKKLEKKQLNKAENVLLKTNKEALKYIMPTAGMINVEPVPLIEKNEKAELASANKKQTIKAVPNNPVKKVKTSVQIKKS